MVGIALPQDSDLLNYPNIMLLNANRVISAQSLSRASKRNDSCIMYLDDQQSDQFGLLQKIVFVPELSGSPSNTYAVVNTLFVASLHLCHDPVTNGKLNHIRAFDVLRLVFKICLIILVV